MICVRRDDAPRGHTSGNVKLSERFIDAAIFDVSRERRATFLLADVSRIQDIGGATPMICGDTHPRFSLNSLFYSGKNPNA